MKNENEEKVENGSIELIVLGLLAALIVVMAIPYLVNIGSNLETGFSDINSSLASATAPQP